MKLTFSNESSGDILNVDVAGSLLFEDFKAYLQAETDLAPANQKILKDGREISGTKDSSIESLGLVDNDFLVLQSNISNSERANIASAASSASVDGSNNFDAQVEEMRNKIINDSFLNAQVRQTNPELHGLINNPPAFKEAFVRTMQQHQASMGGGPYGGGNAAQQEELRRLQQNPDDPDNQRKILEMIQQEQINENYHLANDISPESFIPVTMLYIYVKINGKKVKALVDSGAQVTIVSPKIAEEAGISRLIDKRYIGEMRGVGKLMSEGRIHSVPITIGDSDIPFSCSFNVLDTSNDCIFGLDMMKRHRCIIDLEKDALIVGKEIEAKFLRELDIPQSIFGDEAKKPGTVLGGPSKDQQGSGAAAGNAAAGNAAAAAAAKRQKSNSTGPSSSSAKFKEEDITRLIGLGFNRPQAIQALEACDGNVEMAASMLFSQ